MTKKLMLDAGHGKFTPGKETQDRPAIKEWTLNQKVVHEITNNLKDYQLTIAYSHDPTGNTDIPLSTRVATCNKFNPDLFVSIHHNAYLGKWGNHTGVEVYYHTKGIAEDKKFAQFVAPKLATQTGLKNRGVKTAQLGVLTCKATAILCEGGFMDSTLDHPIITSKKGQQAYAKAISDSIISYLNLKKKVNGNETTHLVIKGDTLWSISKKYNVTVNHLKELNNLTSDLIFTGQTLRIL